MTATVQPRILMSVIIASTSLGLLAATIYVPSIPDMARDLGVPVAQIQLTVTAYVVALGVSTLLIGPLSDRFGRRGVMLGGAALCLVASALCAVAAGIDALLLGRALQAIGACAGMVTARAVVRDVFDRAGTARAMTIIAMVLSLVPVFAPILGGYLHVWFGWRSNFIVVAICAAALVVVVARVLPETNLNLQNQAGLWRSMTSAFGMLLRARRFIGYTLGTVSCGICFFSFVSAAPIILIDRFGVAADAFGIYTALLSFGYLGGSMISHRLANRVALGRLILIGGVLFLVAGALGLAFNAVHEAWTVIVPLVFVGVSSGIVMPVAQAGCVSAYPHLAGAASGLATFIQNMGSAVATVVLAMVAIETALPLTLVYLAAGVISLLGALLIGRE